MSSLQRCKSGTEDRQAAQPQPCPPPQLQPNALMRDALKGINASLLVTASSAADQARDGIVQLQRELVTKLGENGEHTAASNSQKLADLRSAADVLSGEANSILTSMAAIYRDAMATVARSQARLSTLEEALMETTSDVSADVLDDALGAVVTQALEHMETAQRRSTKRARKAMTALRKTDALGDAAVAASLKALVSVDLADEAV